MRKGRIDTVAHESSDGGGVIPLPERIDGEQDFCRPSRNRACGQIDRVADRVVPAAAAIKHSRQHGDAEIGIIVDAHFALAVGEPM